MKETMRSSFGIERVNDVIYVDFAATKLHKFSDILKTCGYWVNPIFSGQCKKHVVKIRSKMLTFAI